MVCYYSKHIIFKGVKSLESKLNYDSGYLIFNQIRAVNQKLDFNARVFILIRVKLFVFGYNFYNGPWLYQVHSKFLSEFFFFQILTLKK
jgi:hypothetical protein